MKKQDQKERGTRRDRVWKQLLIADSASPGHDRANSATVQIRSAINLSDLKKKRSGENKDKRKQQLKNHMRKRHKSCFLKGPL